MAGESWLHGESWRTCSASGVPGGELCGSSSNSALALTLRGVPAKHTTCHVKRGEVAHLSESIVLNSWQHISRVVQMSGAPLNSVCSLIDVKSSQRALEVR